VIDLGLRGRVTLVTGATEGPGRAAARLFAAQGAWVAINYRANLQAAKSLVDEIRSAGGRALPAPGDVRTAEGAWTLARYIEDEWERIDVLLHAAPLLGRDEIVSDPAPLLAELAQGMKAREWGRIVLFLPAGEPSPAIPHALPMGPQVLANTILIPPGDQSNALDEAAARAALFLGSAWNERVTGAVLDLGSG
jgi:3-oxoacyl-[acyl-carrier protein] reductase